MDLFGKPNPNQILEHLLSETYNTTKPSPEGSDYDQMGAKTGI